MRGGGRDGSNEKDKDYSILGYVAATPTLGNTFLSKLFAIGTVLGCWASTLVGLQILASCE